MPEISVKFQALPYNTESAGILSHSTRFRNKTPKKSMKNYIFALIAFALIGSFGVFGLAAALEILPTVTAATASTLSFVAALWAASFIDG